MNLSYPIGKFQWSGGLTPEDRTRLIDEIAVLPAGLRRAVRGLSSEQLETPYRPDGWTVRQVVHHVPDSHMNSFIRFKLALTEDNPTIKPYDESSWAHLGDVGGTPIEVSLALLDALHERWVILLESLTPGEFGRTFRHPEVGPLSLDHALALYAWHGAHHVAHVTCLRERMGWR